ncbi:MAG: hypothetical protein WBA54_00810 [Acidaminobacteraceae bacterium]
MKVFLQKLHMRILYVLKYRKKFQNKDGTGPMAIYIDTRSKRKRKQDEDISLYYGVVKNDIRNKSNTFIAYAIYLRDRGMLVQ